MIEEKELVYICSPLSAPTKAQIRENMSLARFYVKMVASQFRCRAIAPHSFLPEYLDDNIPEEREIGLQFGLSVLELSKAMVVCGSRISRGMLGEIRRAKQLFMWYRGFALKPESRRNSRKRGRDDFRNRKRKS